MMRDPVKFALDPTVTDVVAKGECACPTALVVTPHPITLDGQKIYSTEVALLCPGETLLAFLQRHQVERGQGWVVHIGGVAVPEFNWHLVKPKHGHLVEARRVARQEVLKVVAIVALGAVTFGAGIPLLGIGTLGGGLLGAVGYVAGMAVINALFKPQAVASQAQAVNPATSPTYSLGGGRNQAREFAPMALVLGEPYAVPDLASLSNTYSMGGEQFLHQNLHVGLNCASINTIRIGQTAASSYTGVALHYQNLANGNEYLTDGNVDTVAGAGLLDAPGVTGTFYQRTASIGATWIRLELEGTLYATNAQSGAYEALSVQIRAQYRQVGSGSWIDVPSALGLGLFDFVNADPKPLRTALSILNLNPALQYEVQLCKNTLNDTASGHYNTISWATMHSHRADTGNYTGQARFSLDVQASGQLNGSIEEVNCIAVMAPCPYWNGSAWVTATSRATGLCNPGALLLLLARGIYISSKLVAGRGLPDAQIDIESLKGFMVRCAAKGWYFDYYLQETLSNSDLEAAIAGSGLGSVSWHTGKFGVIWFTESDPQEIVINMATSKVNSFAVDMFTGESADEMQYGFFGRDYNNVYKSVRVVAPGVATVTRTATQKIMGVIYEGQAAVLARFSMAQNTYQKEIISLGTDLEHLTYRRGTVVALSHDVTQWGYGGRVGAAVNNGGYLTLTLDDLLPPASPTGVTTKFIGLRLVGERQYRIFGCALLWFNYMDYSEDFSNAAWVKYNATVVLDGTLSVQGRPAYKLVDAAVNSTHYFGQTSAQVVAQGDRCTLTVELLAAQRTEFMVRFFFGGAVASTRYVIFDAVAGTISYNQWCDAIVTSIGQGWWRLTISISADLAGQLVTGVLLVLSGGNTYLGTGSAGAYVASVLAAKVSPQRLLDGAAFDQASWNKNSVITVTANTIVAPDGTTTADVLVRNASATGNWADLTQNTVVPLGGNVGQIYVDTLWVKCASGTVNFSLVISDANYNTYQSATLTATTTWQLFRFESAGGAGWNALGTYIGLGLNMVASSTLHVWTASLTKKTLDHPVYEQRPGLGARRVTLSTPWPGGVAVPGDSAANPAMDTLWVYDFKATPGQKLRVTEIQPQGNLDGAKVTLVPESQEFWDYVLTGGYTPPSNTSLLQGPPTLSGLVVTEQLKRQGTVFSTELTLTFYTAGSYDSAELWGAINGANKKKLGTTRNSRVSWNGGLAETWSLELRPFSTTSAGTPSTISYTVLGLAVPPAPFDVFVVDVQPDGTRQFNFGYTSTPQPVDWLGAEIRYVPGVVPSPTWSSMALLSDLTTYYTASPVEANQPLAGTWTFACRSIDTTGNESTLQVRTVTLPDRRKGNVFDEYFEHTAGWLGTKTGCHVQDGFLEANDSTTWTGLPATWTAWTRWNTTPASPVYYETPAKDFGVVLAGNLSTAVDADGTVVQELATSADGSTWSGWSSAAGAFNTRYIKMRLTVTATGPAPVPLVRSFKWSVNTTVKNEYLNNINVSALTGSYRIGVGDVRVPAANTYTFVKRVSALPVDNRAGAWSVQRVDSTLAPTPRFQFKLGGTLTDPAAVDFQIEGV